MKTVHGEQLHRKEAETSHTNSCVYPGDHCYAMKCVVVALDDA